MTDLDAMMQPAPDSLPTLSGGAGKRPCRRHEWVLGPSVIGSEAHTHHSGAEATTRCRHCDAVRDAARSRRNRNNRKRGNALERKVLVEEMGMEGIGALKLPSDGRLPRFVAQAKSGGRWSRADAQLLEAQRKGCTAEQVPLVVKINTPGQGRPRKPTQVVMTLRELADMTPADTQVVVELQDWMKVT